MKILECPTCAKLTGFKRNLGLGTFTMILLTCGLWIFVIPLYPIRCIACGSDRGTHPNGRPNFIIPILGLLAILCLVGLYAFHSSPAPPEPIPSLPNVPQTQQTQDVATAPTAAPDPPVQAPDPQPETPPIRVSIDQLAADYQENEFNADSKYKWKNLEVYGTIARIQKSTEGDPVLVLKNFSDFGGVVALLDDGEEDQAAALRPLQIVTLLCVGGGTIQERPVVGKCTIKPTEPIASQPAIIQSQ